MRIFRLKWMRKIFNRRNKSGVFAKAERFHRRIHCPTKKKETGVTVKCRTERWSSRSDNVKLWLSFSPKTRFRNYRISLMRSSHPSNRRIHGTWMYSCHRVTYNREKLIRVVFGGIWLDSQVLWANWMQVEQCTIRCNQSLRGFQWFIVTVRRLWLCISVFLRVRWFYNAIIMPNVLLSGAIYINKI